MAALDGVQVIELGQIYNGPYCGLLLAYLGADVVKVEPLGGDRLRSLGEDAHEFLMLNSNKSSIALNLKAPEARELLLALVRDADVVIENFKNGVMNRMGLGWEVLREANPRLVYADGKGFGSEGPYAEYPAMDVTIQAIAGVMSITGFPENPPVKTGATVADFLGGIHLTAGVLAALYERERTGRGQRVEVAMHDTIYPTLASSLGALYKSAGTSHEPPDRIGNRHYIVAPYNVYPANDGHVAIMCVSQDHWTQLAALMDRPALASEGPFADLFARAARVDELDAMIAEWTAPQHKWDLTKRLLAAGVPAAPVLSMREVADDPHLLARGMIREIEHPTAGRVRVPGNPIRLESSPLRELRPAPRVGEHTAQVLQSLGLTAERIASLRERGVVR